MDHESSASNSSSSEDDSSSKGEDSSQKDSSQKDSSKEEKEEKLPSASLVAKFWARLNTVKAKFGDDLTMEQKGSLVYEELALGKTQNYCKHLKKAGISLIFTCLKCHGILRSEQGFSRHPCLMKKVDGKWVEVPHGKWVEIPMEYITCSQ